MGTAPSLAASGGCGVEGEATPGERMASEGDANPVLASSGSPGVEIEAPGSIPAAWFCWPAHPCAGKSGDGFILKDSLGTTLGRCRKRRLQCSQGNS
jgi:hypothetical protein